jgi:thioredoxin reductase
MGLIRNAFEQGRQCVQGLPGPSSAGLPDRVDLVIVGCGPAGLSAALTAKNRGLRTVVLEREDVGGTVRHYPRKKLVMTEPVTVPGFGKIGAREILKEELIDIWEKVVDQTRLEVTTGVTVTDVQPIPGGGFRVVAGENTYVTDRVILAIGRRGIPRKLGIPGESLSNVAYSLREPEAFSGDRIIVVGGGDSALEASLALAEQPGNEVKIVYRGAAFSRAKPKNRDRLDEASRDGRITVLWSTRVLENRMQGVLLQGQDGLERSLPNNRLFVFAGGELPTPFLERCGVQVDTMFGKR